MNETATTETVPAGVLPHPITEFLSVPLVDLQPSPTNPRRAMSSDSIAELAASIRANGILTPLLVRPAPVRDVGIDQAQPGDGWGPSFEIVAGERRYRAASDAGLTHVPVVVRELSDAEALELQVVENLQREDLHPLDEADGYRALLERGGYDVPMLAERVGKSVSYVYQRLKLAELIDECKQAFTDGALTTGHAILIARLQPMDQAAAVKATRVERYSTALDRHVTETLSVRELHEWIQREVHLDLARAPWKLTDATLVEAAGSCKACPKRTGASPELFADVKGKNTCTDPGCFSTKLRAHIERVKAEAGEDLVELTMEPSRGDRRTTGEPYPHSEWLSVTKGKCEFLARGVLIDGEQRGEILTVCLGLACQVHRPTAKSGKDRDAKKREREKLRLDLAVRRAVFDRIRDKVTELKPKDLRFLAGVLARRLDGEALLEELYDAKVGQLGKAIAALDANALPRLIVELVLAGDVVNPTGDLDEAADHWKVDVAKVRAAVVTEFAAEADDAPKTKARGTKRGR